MRGLSFWDDLVAFLRDWPRWRRERHAHAPTIPHLMHARTLLRESVTTARGLPMRGCGLHETRR